MRKRISKKGMALVMCAAMAGTMMTGCGSNGNSPAASSADGDTTAAEAGKQEKEVIEFWYHAADEKANGVYEELFARLNESQNDYEYHYTGFANKDFPDKFAMAIATDTMPDVVSLGFSNVMTYVAQEALLPVNDYFDKWAEKDNIVPQVVESLKSLAGGSQYGYPYNYNQDICWYNKQLFEERGAAVPASQKEFLAACGEFADSDNGRYFYSLRGNKPYDNLLGWIFTYTDGAGYGGSYFDDNNQCIINRPEFAEALDAYASIYKNQWVSGDCVNNNFNEMVAEFGAGTAMFIMHNSSSQNNHAGNIGAENVGAARPLANDAGKYYASALQPQLYAITTAKGADGDYTGAVKLCEYLASAEVVNEVSQKLGRIPVNTKCYEQDWFKNSEYMPLYQEIMSDPNFVQIKNPYWLTSYFNFINNDMTTDFQALLLGEKTAQEVLDKWAQFLTAEHAAYLEELKP